MANDNNSNQRPSYWGLNSWRVAAAISAAVCLALLTLFAQTRYAQVSDCHQTGGVWDGEASKCRLVPRIIIQRDLRRT